MIVKCTRLFKRGTQEVIEHSSWLTVGRTYTVLEIFAESNSVDFRLIGDDGKTPAYHDAQQFEVVTDAIPKEWCINFKPGMYLELAPKRWSKDGFWEAYFNDDPEAVKAFDDVCRQLLVCES